ncbi:MAG: hypothetical protein DRG20_06615 [Deltaproteobacteria bacterium]|nr:OadG family protein [Deltaproteobacteria bacterium]RLA88087.1 MAG: hypothetical protein DRG20_06615 [Deltaproteobacteria bacterium]
MFSLMPIVHFVIDASSKTDWARAFEVFLFGFSGVFVALGVLILVIYFMGRLVVMLEKKQKKSA